MTEIAQRRGGRDTACSVPAATTLLMAPMAEITTPAFRKCVRKFSSDVILHTEMLSAAALATNALYNEPLLLKTEYDEPLVYQLLGSDPGQMAQSCTILADSGANAVDINMGCSAPDILKKCQGSKLLADMGLAREIVKSCRASFSGSLSVKMRSGSDSSDPVYLEKFALMLQDEGVDYITLHPRHGKLGFKRTADWQLVTLLKNKLRIPVYGNGDIGSAEDTALRFAQTGCDGIMIGRKTVQEPWLFRCCRDLLDTGSYKVQVNMSEIFLEVLADIEKFLPPELHKSRMHRFSFYFTKNFYFSHELFRKIRNVDKPMQAADIMKDYAERNPHENIRIFKGGSADGIHEGLDRT
ncbi:MAG TPA: tRNA-dihydrouridine synthase family protein [Spirochaetota bacterium]|nr:tRNA-dihydrouridine synthase family protein [Spirochaetota bacterium]